MKTEVEQTTDEKMLKRKDRVQADDETIQKVKTALEECYHHLYGERPNVKSDLFKWWITNTFQLGLSLALFHGEQDGDMKS